MDNYFGDANYRHGGYFLSEDWKQTYKDGYVDVLKITDLDSGCGFSEALLVEKLTVIIDNEKVLQSAFDFCGYSDNLPHKNSNNYKLMVIDAMLSYGHYDPYSDYYSPVTAVLVTSPDADLEYDGWTADHVLEDDRNETIYDFLVENNWLNL